MSALRGPQRLSELLKDLDRRMDSLGSAPAEHPREYVRPSRLRFQRQLEIKRLKFKNNSAYLAELAMDRYHQLKKERGAKPVRVRERIVVPPPHPKMPGKPEPTKASAAERRSQFFDDELYGDVDVEDEEDADEYGDDDADKGAKAKGKGKVKGEPKSKSGGGDAGDKKKQSKKRRAPAEE